ncbi:ankyrin repeat-containing domain protein [Infundibulicybe gibba]|nr:ankyrin repeat-containing domain protein [Infundibulicybe gibba]
MHTPSPSFDAAAAYLTSPSIGSVSSKTKLELYGLFKFLTVGPTPNIPRPSIFDMTGRAKWDAWNVTGRSFQNGRDVELRYLDIARDLGWEEGAPAIPDNPKSSDIEEDIWDDDHTSTGTNSGATGLGGSVSTMASRQEGHDESMHGRAIANDPMGILALLEKQPGQNINGRDEFGYTPLHLACDRGNLDAVHVLLSKGADLAIKDNDGFSSAELAKIAGHEIIVDVLASHSSLNR